MAKATVAAPKNGLIATFKEFAMNPLALKAVDDSTVDADLAEQAKPGHGIPSQDPSPAAQHALSPEEAERESKSALMGGGMMTGAAAGAALGVAVGGPVGVFVGGTAGAIAGALGGAAVGQAVEPAPAEDPASEARKPEFVEKG